MKTNKFVLIGCVYIAFFVGLAVQSVGEFPENTGPYEWYLPITMFIILFFPFVIGYLGGMMAANKAFGGDF